MVDIEVYKFVFYCPQHFFALFDGHLVIHHRVARERVQSAGNRPYVEVVDAFHPGSISDGLDYLFHINVPGASFHQDMKRRSGDQESTAEDEQCHHDAGQWISPGPAKKDQQKSGNDRPYGTQHIADYVEVSSAHIKVFFNIPSPHHNPGHQDIDEETNACYQQHP